MRAYAAAAADGDWRSLIEIQGLLGFLKFGHVGFIRLNPRLCGRYIY